MEAIILKTANLKRAAAEEQRTDAERKHWQQEHGAKTVTAKAPPGGW